MIKWALFVFFFYLGVAADHFFGVQAIGVTTFAIWVAATAIAAVAGFLFLVDRLMRGRSHLWYLIPLALLAGFSGLYPDIVSKWMSQVRTVMASSHAVDPTPVAKSSAPAVAKVKPNVAAAVVPTTKSTTKPTAKSVVDEVEAHKRLHDEMLVRLQALAAEGARNGEGCIKFTKRIAGTAAGRYFKLDSLDLRQCIEVAKRDGAQILHYRRPDGSAVVMAPELALGTGSGWHMVVNTVDGVPVSERGWQWSIKKGLP